ncbi:carbohydrate ABC transporter permease [Metabacillus arenae]|uniref:Carbohydrate ABC transporter permease n=1 Tax=Metabacillus arenae TaxID=2771434 RepID=A0A926RXB6_9BACI|nr:carbohydrate ABC transporter permease [Metabacillus arenae]MBD1380495.1 carbohydrate ABC transporter permease [Metabacillus arenae]
MTPYNHKHLSLMGQITKHFLLISLSLLAVLPVGWMLITSFREESVIYSLNLFSPHWTLENYEAAWKAIPIVKMLINSSIVAIGQTFFQLFSSVLAAYAFTRWNFRGQKLLYTLISLTWLVPFQVTMIPNYVTITNVGWDNTLLGLIIPNAVSAFAILSLYQAFKSFPKALIEAAYIEGASNWMILWKIIFPNLRASIASLGVLLFISAWNDYFWPLMVTNQLENTTVQIGLRMFMSSDINMWGPLMAASTLSCLPILAVYLILQRQIIDSFVKWGIR